MQRKVLASDTHRNGIAGTPFAVTLFRDTDGATMLGIRFLGDDPMAVAVLDVAKLAAGDIAFFSNSWRGDTYAGWLREHDAGHDADTA